MTSQMTPSQMTSQMTLRTLLPLTSSLIKGLSYPITIGIVTPMLLYHTWVYIYLGHLYDTSSFYTGCMYAFNYAGTGVAYWIVCRQEQPSHINNMSNIIWCNKEWSKKEGSHTQLMNHNLTILAPYESSHSDFKKYCICWERLLKILIFIWWGATSINVLNNILCDTNVLPHSDRFDDKPLGLWGYYNLSGQYIASICILTGSIMMMTGLFQLKCLIKGYAYDLTKYKDQSTDSPTNTLTNTLTTTQINNTMRKLRDDYLNIQGCCISYSQLWSFPILISLSFCTQVAISSVFVIHYLVQDCMRGDCSMALVFPFIWLFASIAIMGIILKSIADVNQSTQLIKDVFIYADGDIENTNSDYRQIGGRTKWLNYLESNPLSLAICGTIITTKLVVNTGYTIGVALGGFIASNVFG